MVNKLKYKLTSWNCFQFTLACALSRLSKMPPPGASHAAARLWTARIASCSFRWLPVPSGSRSRSATCDARFTEGLLWQLKFTHNSVTFGNSTRIDINFFDNKDLGNLLFQHCPQVMNHSVWCGSHCVVTVHENFNAISHEKRIIYYYWYYYCPVWFTCSDLCLKWIDVLQQEAEYFVFFI